MPGTSRSTRFTNAGLLAVAAVLLLVLAAAQGYVSFRAQYAFVDHAKHARIPSVLEALGLDTGAVIFALLALSLARQDRPATVERWLNVVCALGSLTMNLLAANLTSPRSVTVWVLPSALYALASDRLIAVVRRLVRVDDTAKEAAPDSGSAWRALGGLALWTLRLYFDRQGTGGGFRRWVLAVAPVAPGIRADLPPVTGRLLSPPSDDGSDPTENQSVLPPPPDPPDPAVLAPGETKREALIRLYEHRGVTGDPRYGNRAKAASLAGDIAARIGYHPGTARRELARYLDGRACVAGHPAETHVDTEAVA